MKKIFSFVLMAVALLVSTNMQAGNVAKIGTTEYADLAAAITAVQDGQTITIINDITVTGWVEIKKPDVAFTIDLNGKKIERTDGSLFDIYSKVTFKDSQTGGTIKAKGRALYGNEGADFTLESGNVIGTEGNVINVIGDYGSAKKPAKFTMNGGAVIGADGVNLQGETYGAEFVMNGGTITSEKAGLAWHGNNTEDAVKITINAGTINGVGEGALNGNGSKSGAKVTIVDGTFTCDGGSAMYLPYQGNTTISGGTFTGAEALVIKSGNVSISGGTFIATGAAIDPASAVKSGYAQTGDAIYVEDNYDGQDGVNHNITLNITGGVFTSTNANALSARFSSAHASKVPAQITISGGQFKGATDKDVIYTSNGFAGSIVASAGVYNLAPAQDYIVTGKMAVANTDEATKVAYPWMIGLPSNVAKIGTTEYATLEAAVAAATAGQTITLIADVPMPSEDKFLRFANNVTLDLDNHTITSGVIDEDADWDYEDGYAYVFEGTGLTIQNGTMVGVEGTGGTEGYSYAVYIGNDEKDNIPTKDVTIQNVIVPHGGISILGDAEKATVTVKNCEVTIAPTKYYAVYADNAEVIIDGGSYNPGSESKVLYAEMSYSGRTTTMTVLAGSFDGILYQGSGATFSLKGGIYSDDFSETFVADGYKKVDNEDTATQTTYPYTVINKGAVTDGANKSYANAQAEVSSTLEYWKAETPTTLTIKRNIYKDGYYNTLCLPFDLTNEQIVATFGTYKELKEFISAEVKGEGASREIVLNLKDATSIEAGKAYLITFNTGATLTELVFTGVTVTTTTATAESGELVYQGILAPYQMPYENENYLFVGEQNKLYWAINDGTFMKGFRAYFKVQDTPQSPYRRGMKASFGSKNTPTGNANVNANANEIKKLIENGRVFIMNNGVKYDMNGKVVE